MTIIPHQPSSLRICLYQDTTGTVHDYPMVAPGQSAYPPVPQDATPLDMEITHNTAWAENAE